ncbi:hypothetical protein K1X76_07430 [bacterium]|nr:hypothetical protein [bacterium]
MDVKIIVMLVSAILLFVLLLVSGILLIVRTSIIRSEPYQKSIRFIQDSPDIKTQVGEIEGFGWFPTGRIRGALNGGLAHFFITIYGSRGEGRVHAELISLGYGWEIQKVEFANKANPSGIILFEKK